MTPIEQNRRFMHCPNFKLKMPESDQSKEIPAPPLDKPPMGEFIVLPDFGDIPYDSYNNLLNIRRSVRTFDDKPMTGAELAFMLWSVQGIQSLRGPGSFRPAPSGGARHPFETYIAVKAVDGLNPGIYHYRPTENIGEKTCTIEYIAPHPGDEVVSNMLAGQIWASKAPIVLFYSCIPYKAEWRYVDMAHRVMLIDLGHAGQNAMLSAAALGLGSCCMAAFDQLECDKVLKFDGLDEYTVYAIAVGTPK